MATIHAVPTLTPVPIGTSALEAYTLARQIASLSAAASCIRTGCSLSDPERSEAIADDLVDLIGSLATRVAEITENIEHSCRRAGRAAPATN